MQALVIGLFVLMAMLAGLLAGVFGGIPALVIVLAVLPVVLLFYDYRIGVVCILLLLAVSDSSLLPQGRGFNIFNYLIVGTTLSMLIRKGLSRDQWVVPPRFLVWFYLVPITLGLLVGSRHLGEIPVRLILGGSFESTSVWDYARGHFLKPLRYVLFAWLFANAVRDSLNPSRFLVPLTIGAVPSALAILGVVAYFGDLSFISEQRLFLSGLGMHANELGLMLMIAAGPLLFMLSRIEHRGARWLIIGVLLVVTAALLLTFSRAAFVGLVVIALIYLVSRRQFTALATFVLLGALLFGFGPQQIRDRLTTGLDSSVTAGSLASREDPLTAGRLSSWLMLAPEVLASPLWGRGIGSTAWSNAVRSGRYMYSHPHNLYLEILLDLGIAGFVAIMAFYLAIFRMFRRLASDENVPPLLQGYFSGALAAFVAMLIASLATGHYMPVAEYCFFWASMGLAWAYLKEPQAVQSTVSSTPDRAATGSPHGVASA